MAISERDFEFLPAERLPTEMVAVDKVNSRRELIVEMLTMGKSKQDMVQEILALRHPDIQTIPDAASEIKSVYLSEEIAQQTNQKYILNLHVERYEKLYSKEVDLTDYQGYPIEDRSIIAAKLFAAIKSLKMKEEIIGMNSPKSLQMISSFIASKFQNNEEFNISAINIDEQIELLALMRKIRMNSNDGVQIYSADEDYLDFDEDAVKQIEDEDSDSSEIKLNLPKEKEEKEEETTYEEDIEEMRVKEMRAKLMRMGHG